VLYSATFPERAGFPGCHFLKQIGTGQRAAAWVTQQMLKPRAHLRYANDSKSLLALYYVSFDIYADLRYASYTYTQLYLY
jgi:hypothetical protein